MAWKPIIAGVDPSPEGAWAGAAAWRIADATGAERRLVHAVRERWIPDPDLPFAIGDVSALRQRAEQNARGAIRSALEGNVPSGAADRLEIRFGHPARVLLDAARESGAELVVVGAKRHRRLSQWLAGSTAHDVVRLLETPTLVATASVARVERVLAAVDLSETAPPTIAAAERLAAAFEAELRVMHVIPRIPVGLEEGLTVDPEAQQRAVEQALEESVWPYVTRPDAERVVRYGTVKATIAREAEEWNADVLVVGSHGRGLVDRVLLGSVTEGLLRALPTSVLVVPAPRLATLHSPAPHISGRVRKSRHVRPAT